MDGRKWMLFVAALIAAGCHTERAAAPPPPAGMDSVQVPGGVLYIPTGFHVNVFANENGPRFLALAPDGTVYVALTGAGQVVRLLDLNHDGVAESSAVVASGLTNPHGLAFRRDTLYVAEESGVKRYDPGVASPVQVVSNLPCCGIGHSSRSIAFGPDNMMYVSIGSSSNISPETDTLRAAVLRYNLDGTGGRVFARGLRNSVGIAFNPTTGALWATNNDRDDIGGSDVAMTDSLPPERINILTLGGNYGWPVKEGTFLFAVNPNDPHTLSSGYVYLNSPGYPPNLIDPIAEYDHTDDGGKSEMRAAIIGGFLYEGEKLKELKGH